MEKRNKKKNQAMELIGKQNGYHFYCYLNKRGKSQCRVEISKLPIREEKKFLDKMELISGIPGLFFLMCVRRLYKHEKLKSSTLNKWLNEKEQEGGCCPGASEVLTRQSMTFLWVFMKEALRVKQFSKDDEVNLHMS